MACYFWLSNAAGEWLGSLVGSVLMALVLAAGFGALASARILSVVALPREFSWILPRLILLLLAKRNCWAAGMGSSLRRVCRSRSRCRSLPGAIQTCWCNWNRAFGRLMSCCVRSELGAGRPPRLLRSLSQRLNAVWYCTANAGAATGRELHIIRLLASLPPETLLTKACSEPHFS
jgi:hypothetical protein